MNVEQKKVVEKAILAIQDARREKRSSLVFIRFRDEDELSKTATVFEKVFKGKATVSSISAITTAQARNPRESIYIFKELTSKDGGKVIKSIGDTSAAPFNYPFVGLFLATVDDIKVVANEDALLWRKKTAYLAWPSRPKTEPAAAPDLRLEGPREVVAVQKLLAARADPTKEISQLEAQLLIQMARKNLYAGKEDNARKLLILVAEQANRLAYVDEFCSTLIILGNMAMERNDYRTALQWYQQATPHLELIADPVKRSDLLHQRGHANFGLHQYQDANRDFTAALEIDQELDDPVRLAAINRKLGMVAEHMKDLEGAKRRFRRALELELEKGNRQGLARAYQHMGRVNEAQGDIDRAKEYYEKSLEIKRELDDPKGLASLYHQLGNLRLRKKEPREALEEYRNAETILRSLRDMESLGTTLAQMGLVHKDLGDKEDAIARYEEAHAILQQVGSPLAGPIRDIMFELQGRRRATRPKTAFGGLAGKSATERLSVDDLKKFFKL